MTMDVGAKSGSAPKRRVHEHWLLLAGIVLVAFNLRGSITGVGPLLRDVQEATGMPTSALGLLVTIPLLAFGFISPLASGLAVRFGIERVLIVAMGVLGVATLFRSMPDEWLPFLPARTALFAGTAIIGSCIAIGSVVVPSLIRRDLPDRVGPVMSLFVASFAGIGAVSAGAAVPLEQWIGWRGALATWALPAFVCVLLWIPLARRAPRPGPTAPAVAGAVRLNVWSSPLAWAVTTYMCMQSICFYVLVAWLPSMLREAGQSAAQAGAFSALFQFAGLAGGMSGPMVTARFKDQRWIAASVALVAFIGFMCLIFAPSWPLGGILVGFGTGASLGVSVVIFSARSANSQDTGALSGMAQSVGYGVAAIGPVTFGLLRDATGNWTLSLAIAAVLSLVQIASAMVAGRPGVMRVAGTRAVPAESASGGNA